MCRLRIHTYWYAPDPKEPERLELVEAEASPLYPSEEEALEEVERMVEGHQRLYPGTEDFPLSPPRKGRFLTSGYRTVILEVENA